MKTVVGRALVAIPPGLVRRILRCSTALVVLWLAPIAPAAPEIGEVAPDFAITGADAPTISALRGKMPVAIIFLPSEKALGILSDRKERQLPFLRELCLALEEREVLVVLVTDDLRGWPNVRPVATPAGNLALIRHAYHNRNEAFLGVLVGLDGRVKEAKRQPFAAALPIYELPKRAL